MKVKLQLRNRRIWEVGELEDERDIPKIEEILSESPVDFLILLPIYLKDEDVYKSFYVAPSDVKAVILQEGNIIRAWEVSRKPRNDTNGSSHKGEKGGASP